MKMPSEHVNKQTLQSLQCSHRNVTGNGEITEAWRYIPVAGHILQELTAGKGMIESEREREKEEYSKTKYCHFKFSIIVRTVKHQHYNVFMSIFCKYLHTAIHVQ